MDTCLFSYFFNKQKQKYMYRNYIVLLADDFIYIYGKFSCAFYVVWNFTYIGVLYFSHMVYS